MGETAVLTAYGAESYAWSPSGGLNTTSGAVVEAGPEENTIYTVTGTSSYGCSDNAEIKLFVYCEECALDNLLLDPEGLINHGCTNRAYNNNADCSWIVYPSGATSIYLLFDTLDIRPGDYVRVFNGTSENGELLGEFDNDHLPTNLILVTLNSKF